MAITATHLITNETNSGATSYVTASITPSANKLVLAGVASQIAGGTPNTPTLTGASMTWTLVTTYLDVATNRRISLFRSLTSAPGTGVLTIDFAGQSQTRCNWSISEFDKVDIGGINGTRAIVQTVTGEVSGTNTGLTLTLGAFSGANNATYGVVRHNGASLAITQGTGFTELGELNGINQNIESEFVATNDTTVDWTWASSAVVGIGIAAELKADPSIQLNNYQFVRVGGGMSVSEKIR